MNGEDSNNFYECKQIKLCLKQCLNCYNLNNTRLINRVVILNNNMNETFDTDSGSATAEARHLKGPVQGSSNFKI